MYISQVKKNRIFLLCLIERITLQDFLRFLPTNIAEKLEIEKL